jgi:HAMP domain-containing protein
VNVRVAGGGTVRGKILAFGLGVLSIAALAFAAASVARAQADREARAVAQVQVAQETAAVLESSRAAAGAELVRRVGHAHTAVYDASGRVLARSGGDGGDLAPGAQPVVREAAGWRITSRLPVGGAIVSFLPVTATEASDAGHWVSLLVLLAITYGAVAVLVFISARAMTGPLHVLSGAADRMASGDLTAEPPVLSDDEIGRIANDFARVSQGLSALAAAVQEASRGVDEACHELAEIGGRIREGAAAQRGGLGFVESAVGAMQGSFAAVGRTVAALADYARSTRGAMGELARRLDAAHGEGAELERAMEAALGEAAGLAAAGSRAEQALGGLDALAQRMTDSLGRVER